MAIKIGLDPSHTYLECRYSGTISDEALLAAWRATYASDYWVPGMPQFVDLSDVDKATVTTDGLRDLAKYCGGMLESHGVNHTQVVVYAPQPLAYGLVRMYQAFSAQSPEHVTVTKDWDEARALLADATQGPPPSSHPPTPHVHAGPAK